MTSKYGFKTTAMEVVEGVNLKGREVIVTGGSSGIGVETVRALAKAGARVVIGARNLEKAEAVANDIRESTNNPNVVVEKLDLSSLASVREFAIRFLQKKRPLHILVNNAGLRAGTKSYTVDGFEYDFGTNHLGHFALTICLIPALTQGYKQSGKKSRVVNVSSLGHIISDIIFEDINFNKREWNYFTAYGQSKTANILFTIALNYYYSDRGIVSNAVMPGFVHTELDREKPEDIKVNVELNYKTAEQGASTTVWAALAPELDGIGGKYLENCQFSRRSTPEAILSDFAGYLDYAVNFNNAIKLWDLSLQWIKSK